MADTRNVRQTDDLRLRGLLSGSGMGLGGYMFNSGEEAPSNMPLSAFERGITRAPLSSFNEIDAPDVGDDPMVTGGVEDDIFDMLSQIMVGTQGTIEGLDPETVNVNGGAIALGHPLGCTGAKLTIQLLDEMQRRKQRYGMVTACVGGGQGIAGVFERL